MAVSAQIPAVCDACGMAFPSGFALGPGATATMLNNKSGPCPRCGGWGSVPDGTYRFAQEVEAIVAPWSPGERATLARELRGASQKEERQAAERALRKRPGLIELADRYLKPKDANSFWALVAVILMILSMAGVGKGGGEKIKITEKETVVRLDKPTEDGGKAKKKRPPPPPSKTGRSTSKSKKRSAKAGRSNKKKSRRKH